MLVENFQILLKWKGNVKCYTAVMYHSVGGFFPFSFILGTLNYFFFGSSPATYTS